MRRNKILKITAAACAALTLGSCSLSYAGKPHTYNDFLFDTYVNYTVGGSEDVFNDVVNGLYNIEEDLSRYYNDKPEYIIRRDIGSVCYEKAFALNEIYGDDINVTCGALTDLWGISTNYDPRVPDDEDIQAALDTMINSPDEDFPEGMELDFGAVSKGYACDEAFKLLKEGGAEYAVVDLSSTTLLYGEKPDGSRFRAAVTDPFSGVGYAGIIETDAAFISTSGGYERYFEADGKRYCHILDMKTGRPVETDLSSVTVILPADAEDGGFKSDYLSTLIFIQGTESLSKWLADEDFQVIAIDADGKIYTDCGGFTAEKGWEVAYAG
ncbi:MAG: FAD:protein FMN transferase [Oscillospiraceae bacterium]|nr:FAD:protein FMN transferase [Oscillospiraceae bacterium]